MNTTTHQQYDDHREASHEDSISELALIAQEKAALQDRDFAAYVDDEASIKYRR